MWKNLRNLKKNLKRIFDLAKFKKSRMGKMSNRNIFCLEMNVYIFKKQFWSKSFSKTCLRKQKKLGTNFC